MPFVEIGSSDLYFQEEGEGQPLVFLHGMSSCGEAWFQQFAAFRDRFRVIAYDSVNHGHSSNSGRDEPEPDRADELEDFLTTLGIERPILAGNSMGAMTILRWAIRHPDAAAALIPSGMGVADPAGPNADVLGRPPAGPLDPDVLFLPVGGDALTEDFRERHPLMFDRYLRIRSTATRIEALRHPRERTLGFPGREVMAELVGKVQSPMLVVVGSLDGLLPVAEELHGRVPHSQYRAIEGAPHNVYYEAAEEYNAEVARFLAEVL